MTTLKERLDRIREGFEAQAPAEALEVIHRSTRTLVESDIMNQVPEVGSRLPAFELQDTEGKLVRSADLLERGPLVATFYRGRW